MASNPGFPDFPTFLKKINDNMFRSVVTRSEALFRSVVGTLSVVDTLRSVVGTLRSVVGTLRSVVGTLRSVVDTLRSELSLKATFPP